MTLGVTTLKRWVAALCVALIAFVMIEQGSAAHAESMSPTSAISYNVAEIDVVNDAQGGDHHSGSPVEAQHHCCSAHVSGLPAIAQVAHPMRAVGAHRASESRMAPSLAPLGPERPPKPLLTV